jgi:hypothetical protein
VLPLDGQNQAKTGTGGEGAKITLAWRWPMAEDEKTPAKRPATPAELDRQFRWQHGLKTRRGWRRAEAQREADREQAETEGDQS